MPEFTMERMVIWVLVIIAFIIFAIILGGLKVGAEFWYLDCAGQVKGELVPGKGYANPRCDIMSDKDRITCEFKNYAPITRGNENLTVCVWKDVENLAGVNVTCFLNEELGCEDFSQRTTPKCQDIPDCRPVSAIEVAINRLKPD